VRARRIYNDLACSGGQGGRSSRRTLPLEATRPGLPETRWRFRRNVILLRALRASSSPHRSGRSACAAQPASSAQSHRTKRNVARGHRASRRGSKRSENCRITSNATIDRKHDIGDQAADPAHRSSFRHRALKAIPGMSSPALQCRRWAHRLGRAAVDHPRFQIHLEFALRSKGGISARFCAVSVLLMPGCQCRAVIAIIKIDMVQRFFKFSLS
jgi:hypothetical protein